jgi:phage terminase small subunit
MGLTPKQAAFVDAYAGDASAAARAAGYSAHTAKQAGCRLMKDPDVVAAIKDRRQAAKRDEAVAAAVARTEERKANPHVASRLERQAWWTRIMLGLEMDTAITKMGQVVEVPPPLVARLKASELLGRSEADFTEKMELAASTSFAEALKAARERAHRK